MSSGAAYASEAASASQYAFAAWNCVPGSRNASPIERNGLIGRAAATPEAPAPTPDTTGAAATAADAPPPESGPAFAPEPRSLTSLFNTSNQNGAPRQMANAVA